MVIRDLAVGSDRDGRTSKRRGVSDKLARSRGRHRENLFPWALLAPAVIVLLAMTVAVGIYVVYISFFRVGAFGTPNEFVGLGNYVDAYKTFGFLPEIGRTAGFVAVAVALELCVGLGLALGLAKRARGGKVASSLLIVPFAMTPAVSAMVARVLLDPNYGWVDYYLQRLGLIHSPIAWLSHSSTAWMALIGLDVWEWTPFVALILLAGLQAMRQDVQEAAEVDGAGGWSRFRYVTVPLLAPFIAIAVVLRTIQAFKTFDSFLILTGGGPGSSTYVNNLQIYNVVLQDFNIGAGAAMAVMLLVLLLMLVPVLLRTVGKYAEHERGVA